MAVLTFTANKTNPVFAGDDISLYWTSTGLSSVSIKANNGETIGTALGTQGTQLIRPTADTVYTLEGDDGSQLTKRINVGFDAFEKELRGGRLCDY